MSSVRLASITGICRKYIEANDSIGTVLSFSTIRAGTSASSISESAGAKPRSPALTGDASGAAPQQRIAGKLLQQRLLNGILRPQARPGANDYSGDETQGGEHQHRQDLAKLYGNRDPAPEGALYHLKVCR